MAYADPISVTVNAVAKSLPRSFSAAGSPSIFKTSDDEFRVEISHQDIKGRRERHFFRLTQRKIGADPLVPAVNLESKASIYMVLDNPVTGYSDTELGYLVQAIADFLGNATNKTKFVGGEA
jgi:hypothetical protein